MRACSKTIYGTIHLRACLTSSSGPHARLLLSLGGAVVFVRRCVWLSLLHRPWEAAMVLWTTGKDSFVFVGTELVASALKAFIICSSFLGWKLHLSVLVLLKFGAIDLDLFKFLYVAIYLGNMDLAWVVFVEYLEYRLVFLFVNAKVIGCHYGSCEPCNYLIITDEINYSSRGFGVLGRILISRDVTNRFFHEPNEQETSK